MELVIGGHGQGQRKWLADCKKDIGKSEINGLDCNQEDIYSCGIINGFETYVKRFGQQLQENFAEQLFEKNPDVIILTDEIGCGIVPMERRERDWREQHGRICCDLAARAKTVTRVICGIGNRIK